MQAAFLPAISGWQWTRDGLRLFLKQPLVMFTWAMAISLMVMIATVTPPIGPLIFVGLMPVVTLMTLSACRHIAANDRMLLSIWIKPLQKPNVFKKLLIMGALYTGLCMAAGLLAFLPFSSAVGEGIKLAAASQDIGPFISAMRIPLLLFGTLYVVIAAFFWHAPVLVTWHDLRIAQSLFFSAVACWRNKWAFIVYGATWVFVFVSIDLCASLLGTMGLSLELVGMLQIPFNIAAAGVLYCSFYPAYTTVFEINGAPLEFDHRGGTQA
jgi:hypothetical protein